MPYALKLYLQVVVSLLMWVLRTGLVLQLSLPPQINIFWFQLFAYFLCHSSWKTFFKETNFSFTNSFLFCFSFYCIIIPSLLLIWDLVFFFQFLCCKIRQIIDLSTVLVEFHNCCYIMLLFSFIPGYFLLSLVISAQTPPLVV